MSTSTFTASTHKGDFTFIVADLLGVSLLTVEDVAFDAAWVRWFKVPGDRNERVK